MRKKLNKFKSSYSLPALSFLFFLWAHTTGLSENWFYAISSVFLITSVMTAVHHAEVIAERIGESLGTLVLALSVTIIEVGLIMMLMNIGGPDSHLIARDTVFSAIMIICNGIVGLSLILGGLKYKEQDFRLDGSNSIMVVLILLSALTLVLPSFTSSTAGPTYSPIQLLFTAMTCLVLYVIFVTFQTKTHKNLFEPIAEQTSMDVEVVDYDQPHIPTQQEAWFSFAALILSLITVIGLAKLLAPQIETTLVEMGAPRSATGMIIAIIILLPEAWAAVNSARLNRLQTSLNLALGSGVASIALTIPVIGIYSLISGKALTLGLDAKSLVFLVVTFIITGFTLGTGRTTLLQGTVHLVLLMAYFVLTLAP